MNYSPQSYSGSQRLVDAIYRFEISISQNFDYTFPRYKIINPGVLSRAPGCFKQWSDPVGSGA